MEQTRQPDQSDELAAIFAAGNAEATNFLVDLFQEVNSTLELDGVLSILAERIKPHVGYDAFGVLLLDPLGRELKFHFGLGYREEVLAHWRFGLGQGIVGSAAQNREAILVDDVRSDPRYISGRDDVLSELAIPLIAKNRTIGVLDVQSSERAHFRPRHRRLLSFVAGHIANAIENARLYENLREQARSLSLLNEFGRELTSILDPDALLNRVAELVKRVVDYQVFSVMLWDEETELLEHAFSLKYDERFCRKSGIPLGYGLTGTAAATRQALRVPNVHLDPRFVKCGHQVEVRSELVVPLVFKDRLIGVIDLESVAYDAFSERQEEMLTTLGSYIAVAIENAHLYERVRRDETRLAEEMATAREIQDGLLPDRAPSVPGLDLSFAYAPARKLGGDIYDFLPYGEGRLAIVVGDVAGKATAAALQGALAIGVLRGQVVERLSEPAEALRVMNGQMLQPSLQNRFVAMIFAMYDSHAQTLMLSNAGFPRPLLVRDGVLKEIPIRGLPLGLLEDSRYEQMTLDLCQGDLVLFCSDGILEAPDDQGREFGTGRLRTLAIELADRPVEDLAHELLRATSPHSRQAEEAEDDRTVVALKVNGQSRA